MPQNVIENREEFSAFLAAQPFCRWAAIKESEIARGLHQPRADGILPSEKPKNDNADLAAALASMA